MRVNIIFSSFQPFYCSSSGSHSDWYNVICIQVAEPNPKMWHSLSAYLNIQKRNNELRYLLLSVWGSITAVCIYQVATRSERLCVCFPFFSKSGYCTSETLHRMCHHFSFKLKEALKHWRKGGKVAKKRGALDIPPAFSVLPSCHSWH